jgi:hypothetical protein
MIHNLMEEHVRDSFDGVSSGFPISALATSAGGRLRVCPQPASAPYVRSQQGRTVTEVRLDRDQERATIDVAVIKDPTSPRHASLRERRKPVS